jgi:hypothetical protein
MVEGIRVERLIWDSRAGRFVATGEIIDGGAAELECLANALSGAAGRYLKGPVPWDWIVAAAKLPGHALSVGLCLWRLAGAINSRSVVLGNADLRAFGVDRAGKSRALAALEGAGLVAVERVPGRFPTVTLIGFSRVGSSRMRKDGDKRRRSTNLGEI